MDKLRTYVRALLEATDPIDKYLVVNMKTGKKYGPYKNRKRARRVLDKKDNEYGAYIHKIEKLSESINENTELWQKSASEISTKDLIDDIGYWTNQLNAWGKTKDPNHPTHKREISKLRSIIKIYVDEFKRRQMREWHEHLENVMTSNEALPFVQGEEEPNMDDNPMNPYNANDDLRKVKANSHLKTQKAGVKRGSGPPGGGRSPGSTRQSTT